MSFSTKIAAIIAIGAVFSPMTAFADTGSTAAAVSIKFNSHTDTAGKFSITPGGNANGGGTGISELSAAVATGETEAVANSASSKAGTTAHARGWSAPVTLTYEAVTEHAAEESKYQHASSSKYENQAAIAFAANQSQYQHSSAQSSKDATVAVKKSKKFTAVDASLAEKTASQNASGNSSKVTLDASQKSSASSNNSASGSSASTSNGTKVAYEYSGPATGLKYIPAIVKK
jgi:hypothetical protein